MQENFIYAKLKKLFEEALNNGEVIDEAIAFIEDTKLIWNHGTYFDCSVASEIFEEYKNNTKQSIDGKVDKVSGKQLSTEDFTTELKTRLNGINVYRHTFNDLSGFPNSGDGWYSIIDLGDMEAAFVQISSGQSDTQVAVSAGWGGNDRGSLVVLNTTIDVNNDYAHVKAVRIRRHKASNNDANGYLMLEAKLNRTGYGSNYRNTVVSVFTSADHNPIVINTNTPKVLQLNSSTSETLLQEFELLDKTIMAKAINVETITATNLATVATSGNYNDLKNKPTIPNISNCVTTDQLANVATSGSYEDLLNKPTIPEAYNDTSLREALNQKANKSELFSKNYNDLTNKPTIPAAVTESTVSNWGFTKNTGTITGITMNGVSKGTSGTVDLGTIDTVTKVTWDASSNMDDYKTAGTYEIYGERTRLNDNLPILNASSGHSIAARLTVVDSSLRKTDGTLPTEICVTQFLMLSNRKGGDGNMYVRTYNENNSPAADWWTPWQKLQGIREGYIFTDTVQVNPDGGVQQIDGVTGLNNMVDNGIYSGIYTDDPTFASPTFIDTFTLIVINNYAVAGKDERLKRTISQLKYAVDAITNQASVKMRTKTDGSDWSNWTDIGGGGNNEVDVTDAVNQYGLYTLYSQGFIKDNVVYKYQQKNGELPQFDYSDVIRPFLTSKGHTSNTAITIMIKKFNSIITLDVDMCANLSLGGDNALNHYKFITSSLSAVKVSTDMEELPSTINFTINGDVYTVKRGITWGEAIYKYENIGSKFMMLTTNKEISNVSGYILRLDNNFVHGWDYIRENDAYDVTEGGSAD